MGFAFFPVVSLGLGDRDGAGKRARWGNGKKDEPPPSAEMGRNGIVYYI